MTNCSGSVRTLKMHGAKAPRFCAGGRQRSDLGDFFYEPTILTGVTPEMDCYAHETFGPVVSVYPVADEDAAVRAANDSDMA